jgi:hypothetical protein
MTSIDPDYVSAAWFAAFSSGALAQENAGDSPLSLLAVTPVGAATIAGDRELFI